MARNDQFINDFLRQLDGYGTTTNENLRANQNRVTKPYSPSSNTVVYSRYEYMKNVLSNIQYNPSLGENYINSYRSVIQFYLDKVEVHKADLNYLENGIRKDIANFKNQYQNSRRRSTLGQIDALEFVLKELLYSKYQMMTRIQNSLDF